MSDLAASVKVAAGSAVGLVVVAALAGPASRHFEGYASHTYRDPVGIPTACWGETGPHIRPGMTFTPEQCIALHDESLARTWAGLSCLGVDLAPNEAAAVLSWAHNIGTRAACNSTLARLVRAGAEPHVWCPQLTRWVYGTRLGVKIRLPGLVTRRAAETRMCIHGRWGIPALDHSVEVQNDVQPD